MDGQKWILSTMTYHLLYVVNDISPYGLWSCKFTSLERAVLRVDNMSSSFACRMQEAK